ncbi:unnamed protein product, partial [Amoebophrya sp. A25]
GFFPLSTFFEAPWHYLSEDAAAAPDPIRAATEAASFFKAALYESVTAAKTYVSSASAGG